MHTSIREIRRRLFLLLARAFVIVLFLSFVFFIFVTGYFLTSSSSPIPFPLVDTLEGYYLANESWDGVEKVIDTRDEFQLLNSVLLDEKKRIIFDLRPDSVSVTDSAYKPQPNDITFELKIKDEIVGYLIVTSSFASRFGFARAILFPIGLISFILAMFLVVVAILLVRRFVNPLADVIYAARAVADGKFDTRISSEGPQDLQSLAINFNEMASSLERNDKERREMLADVAHELRTPLSVIRGRLEGIIDGVYAENSPQVSMALEQTYILERLIDDLRLLTLAETRQLAFDNSDVNLVTLIERVINMFSAEAQEKNISLMFIEEKKDLTAYLDAQRIEQVLSNLISNAIRYIPEGSKVWVTARQITDYVELTINDNGAGLANSDLPFIFERFWRKDKSRSRTTGGTGLGLAIASQLVKAQGGTIEVQNLAEGGLQVKIRFFKNS